MRSIYFYKILGLVLLLVPTRAAPVENNVVATAVARRQRPISDWNLKDPCTFAADIELCQNKKTITAHASQVFFDNFELDSRNGRISFDDAEKLRRFFPYGSEIKVDLSEISQREFLVNAQKFFTNVASFALGEVADAAGIYGRLMKTFFDPKAYFTEGYYQEKQYQTISLQLEVLTAFSRNAFTNEEIISESPRFRRYIMDEFLMAGTKTWGYLTNDQRDRYMFAAINILHERVSKLEGDLAVLDSWGRQTPPTALPDIAEMDRLTSNTWNYMADVKKQLQTLITDDPDAKAAFGSINLKAEKSIEDIATTSVALTHSLPATVSSSQDLITYTETLNAASDHLQQSEETVHGLVSILKLVNPRAARDLANVYKGAVELTQGLSLLNAATSAAQLFTGIGTVGAALQLFSAVGGSLEDPSAAMGKAIMKALGQISQQIQRLEDIVVARFDNVDLRLSAIQNQLDVVTGIVIQGFSKTIERVEDLRRITAEIGVAQAEQSKRVTQMLQELIIQPYLSIRNNILKTTWKSPRTDILQLLRDLDDEFSITFFGSNAKNDAVLRGLMIGEGFDSPLRAASADEPTRFGDNFVRSLRDFTFGKGFSSDTPIALPATVSNPGAWADACRLFAFLVLKQNMFEETAKQNSFTWIDVFAEERTRIQTWLRHGLDIMKMQLHIQTNQKLFDYLIAEYERTEADVRTKYASLMWQKLVSDVDQNENKFSAHFNALMPASLHVIGQASTRQDVIDAWKAYRSAFKALWMGQSDPVALQLQEFPLVLPEGNVDSARIFPIGTAFPVLQWPGHEATGTDDRTMVERERTHVGTEFKVAELLGLGFIEKRYKVNGLGRPGEWSGLEVTYNTYFVKMDDANTKRLIASFVYQYICPSASPNPNGANTFEFLAALNGPAPYRMNYASAGRRFTCQVVRRFVSETRPSDTGSIIDEITATFKGHIAPLLSGYAHSNMAITDEYKRFHDASNRLHLFATYAFPRSMTTGNNLALGLINPLLAPYRAFSHTQEYARSSYAFQLHNALIDWTTFKWSNFYGEDKFRAMFMSRLQSAQLWNNPWWINWKASLNHAIARSSAHIKATYDVVRAAPKANTGNNEIAQDLEFMSRIAYSPVELDPRLIVPLRFLSAGLKVTEARSHARTCNETTALPDQTIPDAAVDVIPNGYRVDSCLNRKHVSTSLNCDYGYSPSTTGECLPTTCRGMDNGIYQVGQTFKSVNTAQYICGADGNLNIFEKPCANGNPVDSLTCQPFSCGRQHPDATVWTEAIPNGQRTWSCTAGNPVIQAVTCSPGWMNSNGRCAEKVSCGNNRYWNDSWSERIMKGSCVIEVHTATCTIAGTVDRKLRCSYNQCQKERPCDQSGGGFDMR
ncbi:hypothetical protein HDU85_002926 [Gaertneriomyces sp. JEL0708]|nr:hypothetical protein HDU85_002926 [Gaertneriomyces sp. JEL0708]